VREPRFVVAEDLIGRAMIQDRELGHSLLEFLQRAIGRAVGWESRGRERHSFLRAARMTSSTLSPVFLRELARQSLGFRVFDGQRHDSILMLDERPVRIADNIVFGDELR
jgi:hypothetical protein